MLQLSVLKNYKISDRDQAVVVNTINQLDNQKTKKTTIIYN